MFSGMKDGRLFPYRPIVSARQLVRGELPVTALQTRYIALVASDSAASTFGRSNDLFVAVEMLESGGWEVVSFAHDDNVIYAYLRQVTRQPGQSAPHTGHAAG